MLTISKPLSAGQARSYHEKEFANVEQNYYSQKGAVQGEWTGKLAAELTLEGGGVAAAEFERLAEGQHPVTGEQMVQHRVSRTYVNERGETVTTAEHRAGWDATFSAVSITALVGGDGLVHDACSKVPCDKTAARGRPFVYDIRLLTTTDTRIRRALKRELLFLYKDDPGTVIIEELGVHHGTSRIDLAVVNGLLHGFELKSDRDTLARLPEQASAYGAVFDRVTLVVGERHVRRAVDVVPDWWGIRVARAEPLGLSFCDLKLPIDNPSRDPMSVAALLWRNEALGFLEELGTAGGMHSKSRAAIYSSLLETVDFNCLCDRVRRCLRERRDWRSAGRRLSCGD